MHREIADMMEKLGYKRTRIADAGEGGHAPMPIDHRCCGNCKWMTRVYGECLCEHPEQNWQCVHGHYVCDLFEQ